MNKRFFLTLLAVLCGYWSVSAQQVAVKTNLLYWATTTPNIGVEMALSDHFTVSLSANYNPWTVNDHAMIQHWFVQPEIRYWLSGKFTRSFIGAHMIAGQYKLGGFKLPFNLFSSFQSHHYKGWAVGVGLTYGYQFYISPHWNLEASLGVGYARTKYDRYDLEGNYDYTHSRNYFGPTHVGISFIYLFNARK